MDIKIVKIHIYKLTAGKIIGHLLYALFNAVAVAFVATRRTSTRIKVFTHISVVIIRAFALV